MAFPNIFTDTLTVPPKNGQIPMSWKKKAGVARTRAVHKTASVAYGWAWEVMRFRYIFLEKISIV